MQNVTGLVVDEDDGKCYHACDSLIPHRRMSEEREREREREREKSLTLSMCVHFCFTKFNLKSMDVCALKCTAHARRE